MPFYEIKHHIPLTTSQKDELAQAITRIHSTKFRTPKLFVNVAFTDVSNADTYVAGRRLTANHLHAHVRNNASRSRSDWKDIADQYQKAWDDIVGKGLPKVRRSDPDLDTSLRSIIFMGDLTFGMELGFVVPPAGEDVEWMQENWGEFNRRAEEGDEDFRYLVEEVQERKLMANGDGKTAQQRLEEALGWGDSA